MERQAENNKRTIFLKIVFGKKKDGTFVLQGEPLFTRTEIVFYPIPKQLLRGVKEKEIWEGQLCTLQSTHKRDTKKRLIYFQYFIPLHKKVM